MTWQCINRMFTFAHDRTKHLKYIVYKFIYSHKRTDEPHENVQSRWRWRVGRQEKGSRICFPPRNQVVKSEIDEQLKTPVFHHRQPCPSGASLLLDRATLGGLLFFPLSLVPALARPAIVVLPDVATAKRHSLPDAQAAHPHSGAGG